MIAPRSPNASDPVGADARVQYWELMQRLEALVLTAQDMNSGMIKFVEELDDLNHRMCSLENVVSRLIRSLKDAL